MYTFSDTSHLGVIFHSSTDDLHFLHQIPPLNPRLWILPSHYAIKSSSWEEVPLNGVQAKQQRRWKPDAASLILAWVIIFSRKVSISVLCVSSIWSRLHRHPPSTYVCFSHLRRPIYFEYYWHTVNVFIAPAIAGRCLPVTFGSTTRRSLPSRGIYPRLRQAPCYRSSPNTLRFWSDCSTLIKAYGLELFSIKNKQITIKTIKTKTSLASRN